MAIHDDNWTKEFKKIGMLETVSELPLVLFICIIAYLCWFVPLTYAMVVSNPTGAMKFSLVSGGIVMVAIAIKAALKLYVNHTRK